jgi:thiamine kinase-like enzyme
MYKYIKLSNEDKRFFCLNQNPVSLAWLLFFSINTLSPLVNNNGDVTWSMKRFKEIIAKRYLESKINVRRLVRFVRVKLKDEKFISAVELPVYGQACVLVNKGYKIFDHRRKIVIKVFRDDVDMTTIKNELERLQYSSLFKFGNALKEININQRYYEEEYVEGSLDYSALPRKTNDILSKFSLDVLPCLTDLMQKKPEIKVDLIDYLKKVQSTLKLEQLNDSTRADPQIIGAIHNFLDQINRRFNALQNKSTVFSLISHGDFCPANMLNTKNGMRILDWESATYRSALFDFYSYFFFRPLHQNFSLKDLEKEIAIALQYLTDKIESMNPSLCINIKSNEMMYRWLFYIERISMLVEREKYDTKLNTARNIVRYIAAFERYENYFN